MLQLTPAHLTLITIDLSFHVAASAVVQHVLAEHGVETSEIRVPHERAFELLAQGGGDMLCAAWLPGSHGAYLAPFAHEVDQLAVLYTPYALWGVPDYVPMTEVASLADLAKPEIAARMQKRIQGIGPGAGISRFSREIMARYSLESQGYHFENGTLDDCVQAFEGAVAEQRWVVVPLWHPQYLHWQHRIRALQDPEGLLRGEDQATLLLRRASRTKLPEAARAALQALQLGNPAITMLDHLTERMRLTPHAAAARLFASDSELP
ncbi:MAG: glycine betaine ABC transporter substrate-binding protein [Burkholderiales bacterium]|nr:glycine betaine ABC transporter substrate-binding protein [Burkholderiales bacterium]